MLTGVTGLLVCKEDVPCGTGTGGFQLPCFTPMRTGGAQVATASIVLTRV